MRIAVCEDDKRYREFLLRELDAYGNGEFIVRTYSSGDHLWFDYEDNAQFFDLILLDIELPGELNGLAAARKIRETGDNVMIVIITAHDKYLLKGYDIEAFRYLIKPIERQQLFDVLEVVKKRVSFRRSSSLNVEKLKGGMIKVPYQSIIYMEGSGHSVIIHTTDGEIIINRRLYELSELCDRRFVATHRSYVINADRVRRIENNKRYALAILDTGDEIPIAQTKKKELFEYLAEYDKYMA